MATRVSADEFRVMAASVHHLCSVRAYAANVATWDHKQVYIGKETPRIGRRCSVRANSQMTEGHVVRKEAIRSFRHDLLDLHGLTQR